MIENHRLTIRGASNAVDPRFAVFACQTWSLTPQEAASLCQTWPLELVLVGADEEERTRITTAIAALGLETWWSRSTLSHSPCARHAKLAATEVCPVCREGRCCAACASPSAPGGCPNCAAASARKSSFRRVRIGLLLLLLAVVALTRWQDHRAVASWSTPLVVSVIPIAGDASSTVQQYLEGLGPESFAGVTAFFRREGDRYGIGVHPPIVIKTERPISSSPPEPPNNAERSPLAVMQWSLRMRWWNWRTTQTNSLGAADVRLYAIYQAPRPGVALDHSLGLEQVRVGVAHLFSGADEEAANAVVIAHELLHIVGASDKYDDRGEPIFPDGYAEPSLSPLHPQSQAEIMGGRIPASAEQSAAAEDLETCVIGPKTAAEIGWAH